ncbi:MAG: hypothetical protein DRZ79_02205, partial [Candidatus Cloacimonadota bacterium]
MLKTKKPFIFSIFLLIVLLLIGACGRKGELSPNSKPRVTITSYAGAESDTLITDTTFFQQKIYWTGYDEDGVVDAYAFRVLDENGNPISTPGYEYIDNDGWVYHYQAGADETIPMDDPNAKITIWTDQVYAEINFPANINGELANVISVFEVKCIDNRGTESDIARKYFKMFSSRPVITVSSSKGEINGKTIGTGVVFEFKTIDLDNGASDVADYFLFKLIKGIRNEDGEIVPVATGGYDDEWLSTKGQTDIAHYLMTKNTDPPLLVNSFEPLDSTFLVVKAVNIAGVVSEPDTISFFVKEGFYPGTIIYNGQYQAGNDVWVLGEHHFTTFMDESISKIIEFENYPEGAHYSTPFWIDKDGNYSVIGSEDLKIYMHWGWHGEHGNQLESAYVITDNPFDKKIASVVDEQTNVSYFAEIKYFDLRLDGEPYYYPPLPPEGENLQIDEDGKAWLRVPITHEIAQETIITGLSEGVHRFEVRAVDIQDVGDETPAEFVFKIVKPIPREEKSGVLILDDDDDNSLFAPDAIIDSLYEAFLSDYAGEVMTLDRGELEGSVWDSQLHFGRDVFSPTDLEKYKLVIYHSDYLTVPSKLQKEFEVLFLYLRGGGNLVISIGKQLRETIDIVEDNSNTLFDEFFGMHTSPDESLVKVVTKDGNEASFLNLAYFQKALASNGFSDDIDLQIPSFNSMVNYSNVVGDSVKALGPVAYFEESLLGEGTEVIYRFGCKESGDSPLDPSMAEYEMYNGQPVAISKITENNNCYLFGFPLSYMEVDDVKL